MIPARNQPGFRSTGPLNLSRLDPATGPLARARRSRKGKLDSMLQNLFDSVEKFAAERSISVSSDAENTSPSADEGIQGPTADSAQSKMHLSAPVTLHNSRRTLSMDDLGTIQTLSQRRLELEASHQVRQLLKAEESSQAHYRNSVSQAKVKVEQQLRRRDDQILWLREQNSELVERLVVEELEKTDATRQASHFREEALHLARQNERLEEQYQRQAEFIEQLVREMEERDSLLSRSIQSDNIEEPLASKAAEQAGMVSELMARVLLLEKEKSQLHAQNSELRRQHELRMEEKDMEQLKTTLKSQVEESVMSMSDRALTKHEAMRSGLEVAVKCLDMMQGRPPSSQPELAALYERMCEEIHGDNKGEDFGDGQNADILASVPDFDDFIKHESLVALSRELGGGLLRRLLKECIRRHESQQMLAEVAPLSFTVDTDIAQLPASNRIEKEENLQNLVERNKELKERAKDADRSKRDMEEELKQKDEELRMLHRRVYKLLNKFEDDSK